MKKTLEQIEADLKTLYAQNDALNKRITTLVKQRQKIQDCADEEFIKTIPFDLMYFLILFIFSV